MAHRIVNAAKRVGIGLTLLPVLYSIGGYSNLKPNEGQRRYMLDVESFLKLVERLSKEYRDSDQIRIGIAPHSVRQVPPKLLADALTGFDSIDSKGPIHIHVAEQLGDVVAHIENFGACGG